MPGAIGTTLALPSLNIDVTATVIYAQKKERREGREGEAKGTYICPFVRVILGLWHEV